MSQDVSIRLSNNVVQAVPGESAEIAITVVNNSRTVERFEIRLADLDSNWYQLDWTEMLLYPDAPGNEGTVYLRLNIPPDAMMGAYAPAVEVFSDSEQAVVAHLPLALNVVEPQLGDIEIEVLPPIQVSRASIARFQVALRNGSSRPTSMRLTASSADPTASVRIIPSSLELAALNGATALLEIRPRQRNLISPDREFAFGVSVDNLGLEAVGQFFQTASLPWLRRILVTPFLLFVSLLIPLLIAIALILVLLPRSKDTQQTAAVARTASRCAVPTAADSQLIPNIVMDDQTSTIVLDTPDLARRTPVATADVALLPGDFASLISLSPDGKQIAYVTADDAAMRNATIWTAPVGANGKSSRIIGLASGLWPSRPVWSPDSKYLTYVKRNSGQLELYTVNLADNQKKQTLLKTPATLLPEAFYGDAASGPICWSLDGSRVIVAGSQDTNQVEVSVQDNTVQTFLKPASLPKTARFSESNGVYAPAAAPDIITPPLPPNDSTDCFVKTFSQNDPRWSDNPIRSSTDFPNDTLGGSGCAIASAAMVLNYYQSGSDPNTLNTCLAERAVPFNWRNLLDTTCSGGKTNNVERNSFSWASLDTLLGQGQPAIVGLLGGQTGVQFVVVVSGADGIASTYRVNDPWDGTNYKSLDYFISKGYKPRWLVNLTPSNRPTCGDRRTTMNKLKPEFKLSATTPEDGGMYQQGFVFSFQAEGNISTTARLYTLTTADAISTTATTQAVLPATEIVQNNDSFTREGFYELVIEATTPDGTVSRLTRHFAVDRTPPQARKIPPKNNVLDPTPTQDGFQIAKGRLDLELGATDRLTRIAKIEYQVSLNGSLFGAWTPYLDDVSSKPIKFDTDGLYVVNVRSEDGAGNSSGEAEALRFRLQKPGGTAIVTTPPATTPPPIATQPPVVTEPPVAAGNNGNNGNNAGGANNAGNAGGQGGAAAVTPPTTPPVAPPVALIGTPNPLTLDATQSQTNLQLINSGAIPIGWSLQDPTGPAAGLIKLTQQAGIVPPAGSVAVPIALGTGLFNFTDAPLAATLTFVYNSNNQQANLVVPITIAPQPAPTVQFVSPLAGPLLVRSVPIRLQVTPNGAAKPNHVSLSAKFADQLDAAPTDHPLSGGANLANGWLVNWDIGALPPQATVEVDGKVCWTADETACTPVSPALTGLSIPKPTATFTLDPASDKLAGIVNINAVVTGNFDHITYKYTAQTNGVQSQAQTLPNKATPTQLSVGWDTGQIPPASTVKLTALLCLTTAEPTNCSTIVLPNNFTLDSPTVAINPLATNDAANIPFNLNLSGSVNKLNVPAGSTQATVFVIIKFTKTATGQQLADDPTVPTPSVTISNLSGGAATWTISNINTAAWKSGTTVTFTPLLCWDGNRSGANCFQGQTSATGNLPDLVAVLDQIPPNSDLSRPINLKVTPIQPTRINTVKLIISYLKWDGTGPVDAQPIAMTGAASTGFSYSFDSVALGLAPQGVNFKVVACNNTDCGPTSTPTTLQIPATTVTPNPAPSALTALGDSVSVTPTLAGRGVSSMVLRGQFRPASNFFAAPITSTIGTPTGPLPVGPTQPFVWQLNGNTPDTQVPPQPGISLGYQLCWGSPPGSNTISLDYNCQDYAPIPYQNLYIPEPKITTVYANGAAAFDPTAVLPIPIGITDTTVSLSLPMTATVNTLNGVGKIGWGLGLSNSTVITPLGTVALPTGQSSVGVVLTLSGLNVNTAYNLIAYPIWNRPGTPDIPYANAQDEIQVPLKFVPLKASVATRQDGVFQQFVPPAVNITDTDKVMVSKISKLNLNFSSAAAPSIKRVTFFAAFDTDPPQPISSLTGTVVNPTQVGQDWNLDWDHTSTLPRLDPVDLFNLQKKVTVSWQICSTTGDGNCTNPNTIGTTASLTGLVMGGLELPRFLAKNTNQDLFDPNSDNIATFDPAFITPTVPPPADYFNSSFNAQVYVPATKGAIKQVRFVAYPTPLTTPFTPDKNAAVVLRTVTETVASDTSWNVFAQWPDETISSPQPGNIANFVTAVNANRGKTTISAQYCLDPDPNLAIDDPKCSEWSGTEVARFFTDPKSHSTYVSGQQAVIVSWLPYTDNNTALPDPPVAPYPYGQYIQDGAVVTRTLNVAVVPILSSPAVSVSFASALAIQTNYNLGNLCPAANPGNGTPTITDPTALPSVMSKTGSSYNYKIYSTKWNVKNLQSANLFPTETNGQPPGVCLIASANLILTGSAVISGSTSTRSGSATLTHGKNPAGYTPASSASPRPTPSVSPSPTAGPTAIPLPSASPTIAVDTPLPTPTAAAPLTPTPIPPTPTAIPTASPLPTTVTPQPTPTVTAPPTAGPTTAASSQAGSLPNPFAGLI